MHIAILAPSHKSFISIFLQNYDQSELPEGFFGAPFIGTIIFELLKMGHHVTAITTSSAISEDYAPKQFKNENFSWIVIPSRRRSFAFNGSKLGRIVDFYRFEQIRMINVCTSSCTVIFEVKWNIMYVIQGLTIIS